MKNIILIGGFIEVFELCDKCGYKIVGLVDNYDTTKNRYEYLGNDEQFLNDKDKYMSIPLFIVPDSPKIRKKLFELYEKNGFKFETIVSPDAIVSPSAKIEEGCMIQAGCIISSNAIVKKGTRVNCCANVMHDTILGQFTTVAPSAVLLGHVNVGENVYIGANATILPGKTIVADTVIGAGAVVTKDVDKAGVLMGCPAKYM